MTKPANSPKADRAAKPDGRKLGLILLTGVVVGSMIGGGAFNLPQNMARGAALGAVTIAWIVTLVGMFFLSNTFRTLADERPDLKAGIYRYAQEGFGPLAGFEMAWGYWLSSAFGNVAFAVLVMQMLGYFFPIFGDGKNWPSVIGGSVLIWTMHFIVLSGVKRAVGLNVLATFVNVITIGVILVVMVLFVRRGQFAFDLWGHQQHLAGILTQVKSTMLVTLWVFLGIEAGVVVSDRAKEPAQVGTATFIGLALCAVLYFLLSALPFGVMHQKELAGLGNPSAAFVLQALVGHWGAIFVNLALLFSTLFCWLAWTVLAAELPYEGAKGGVFPKFLARENRHHAPAPSLWMSSIVMQITMFVVLFAHERLDMADLDHGGDEPAALSRQHGLSLALCREARIPGERLGNPRHGSLDGHSRDPLFGLASLRRGPEVSALVDDRLRHRPAGLLVCSEGTRARQARLHANRDSRGDRACHRGNSGHRAVRGRHRQHHLITRMRLTRGLRKTI